MFGAQSWAHVDDAFLAVRSQKSRHVRVWRHSSLRVEDELAERVEQSLGKVQTMVD